MLYKNSAIILLTVDNFSSVKNYQILAISNRGGGGGGGEGEQCARVNF